MGLELPGHRRGGSANCDPAGRGFFLQGYGMAKQWSRYRPDPDHYNYQVGQTVNILWNVAESRLRAAPVTIENLATAACTSTRRTSPTRPRSPRTPAGRQLLAYGNRNFFFMFRKYFGPPAAAHRPPAGHQRSAVLSTGTAVNIPNNQYVSAALAGQTITAPNARCRRPRRRLQRPRVPYVWGGGGSGAGPNNGCARGGGDYNSVARRSVSTVPG